MALAVGAMWNAFTLANLISFHTELAGSADEGTAADVFFFFLPDINNALDFVSHSILINHEIVQLSRQYNEVAELWVSKTCN